MATRIFHITSFTNGVPNMENKGNVTCALGDTIQWNIAPSVGTISAIRYKSGTYVFVSGPCPMKNSPNWQGVISKTVSGVEDYTIIAAPKGGEAIPHDPRITVNPGGNP